jgi:two-component system cell cycle sensor histidine kinase/response regulator CckA
MPKPTTVKVPPQFEEIFAKSEQTVSEYFKNKREDPTKGTISIGDERYILMRAASLSVEFFNIISDFFKDKGQEEAQGIAKGILYDLAHAIGKSDAEHFHTKMNLEDPIAKLSAGPVHFAYAGQAFVEISPESKPTPDENFLLIYDHPYSFESDSWLKKGKKADLPICIMNAGYSSGWCEYSFGIPLVAVEIMCQAKGDQYDRFIMAHPSKIEEYLHTYAHTENQTTAPNIQSHEIPSFLNRKIQEEILRKNNDLAKINSFMVDRELKMIELKAEITKLKSQLEQQKT